MGRFGFWVLRLTGRVVWILDTRVYPLSCTECSTSAVECLRGVMKNKRGCCDSCHDGNTHPVPGDMPCAEWGAKHGAAVR